MKMLTPTLLIPSLLSLTLAACICLDDQESSGWERPTKQPSTTPTDNTPALPRTADGGRPTPDGGVAEAGASRDGGGDRGDIATRPDAGGGGDAGCPGGNAGSDGGGGCGVRPPPVCQFNNQCGLGGRCRNGACERPCQSSASCGTGHTCQEGFCQPPGTSGGQCVYDRDCGAGRTCINGFCHADCQTDTDCGPQDRCTAGVCKPDSSPQPECRASTDCADGKMCVNAICRAACTTDAECCIGGVIGPTCRMGYCLTAHETSPACHIGTDCTGGLSCIDAVCN